MPRISTIPTLLEERKFISLKELKKWGYLNKGITKNGSIQWSRNGEVYSSISLYSNMNTTKPFLLLKYTKRDVDFLYKVYLVGVPSNLGEGEILYFECPQTKKRCRKLYLIGDYFAHREACKRIYYEKQTYSKRLRDLDRFYTSFHKQDKAQLEIWGKHFKRYYKGQPTKRFKRLSSIIAVVNNYTENDFFSLKKRRFF